MPFLARVAVGLGANVLALFVAAWLVDGVTYHGRWQNLLVAGLVFGLVNTLLKPLVKLLALPLIVLSLGVGLFLVNMLMLWLTDALLGSFDIAGFWATAAAALVVWLVNLAVDAIPGVQETRKGKPRRAR